MSIDTIKERIINRLEGTEREGVADLINYMITNGFFKAPCSAAHHLAKPGGLAEHSYNVLCIMLDLSYMLNKSNIPLAEIDNTITITAILHDLGKMGQFDKPGYIPNMLKGRATKANPDPQPYQSDKKPYVVNPDLLYVDHEVRSITIASKFIDLTEEEQQAAHDIERGQARPAIVPPGKAAEATVAKEVDPDQAESHHQKIGRGQPKRPLPVQPAGPRHLQRIKRQEHGKEYPQDLHPRVQHIDHPRIAIFGKHFRITQKINDTTKNHGTGVKPPGPIVP